MALHRRFADHEPLRDLGVLAAWAAVGLVVALRRFAWAPAAAPA